MPTFRHRSRLEHPAGRVYDWHARPGAFDRLAPPWERIVIQERYEKLRDGARLRFRLRKGPVWLTWQAIHSGVRAGRQFIDEQERGPFAAWRHIHRFTPEGERASTLDDEIRYRIPLEKLLMPLAGPGIRRELRRTFEWRHRRTRDDLQRHDSFRDLPRLRVAITGASGLVGSALTPFLTAGGHRVERLVRRPPGDDPGGIYWRPSAGVIDAPALEGIDAAVHLAGENIGANLWTEERKRRIRESRIAGTRVLCEALAGLERPPRTLISASAVGYYGDRGDEVLDEGSGPGSGFLADLCQEWEAATAPARDAGIRVVNLRIGIVLSAAGGIFQRMLLPFRLGLGASLGPGDQYVSWIALDDLVGLIHWLLYRPDVTGPVNAVSPGAVTQAEWAQVLGRVLKRPVALRIPETLLRAALPGGFAREALLASTRVQSRRTNGFRFLQDDLETAMRWELGRPAPETIAPPAGARVQI